MPFGHINPQEHDYYDEFNNWLETVSNDDLSIYQRDLDANYNSWQMVWERKAVRLEIERRTAEHEEDES